MYFHQQASDADPSNEIQDPGEPLRDYLDRFWKVASQVHASDATALAALRRGLLIESRYYEDLSINHPRNLESALHRGAAFVSTEKDKNAAILRTARSNPSNTSQGPANTPRRKQQQQPYPSALASGSSFGPQRQAAYAISTDTIDTNTWFRPSACDSAPDSGEGDPPSKYCEYHKLNGHHTTECRHLQEYLFSLLLSGTITLPEKSTRNNRQQMERSSDGSRPRSTEVNPQTKDGPPETTGEYGTALYNIQQGHDDI